MTHYHYALFDPDKKRLTDWTPKGFNFTNHGDAKVRLEIIRRVDFDLNNPWPGSYMPYGCTVSPGNQVHYNMDEMADDPSWEPYKS